MLRGAAMDRDVLDAWYCGRILAGRDANFKGGTLKLSTPCWADTWSALEFPPEFLGTRSRWCLMRPPDCRGGPGDRRDPGTLGNWAGLERIDCGEREGSSPASGPTWPSCEAGTRSCGSSVICSNDRWPSGWPATERHEALLDRDVMKGHRLGVVAAGW